MKPAFKAIIATFVAFSAAGSLHALELKPLATLKLGAFDEGAAEMADYDPATKRLFAVNSEKNTVAVIDLSDPSAPQLVADLDVSEHGKAPNCVATNGVLVAVAVEAEDTQAPGRIAFFTTAGEAVGAVDAGALPDHVIFSPDGKWCLVANEGEPSDDYKTDPEGSVTIVDVSSGKPGDTRQVKFDELVTEDEGVRVYGPGATLAQDLEPEFIAVCPASETAWVVCQENNAVVTIDIANAKATGLRSLGFKDHLVEGSGFDASNKTDAVEIRPWPTRGMYQPDAIVAFSVGGATYIATANEGDSRDYVVEDENGEEQVIYSEEVRVKDLKLDPEIFPAAAELQQETALGRLKVSNATGDIDGDGDFEEIHSLGARSFSIWDSEWNRVYDSGDEFEQVTAKAVGEGFNSTNDEQPSFKDRSDDKGPEPEALAIGVIGDKTYAFIGLERVGGIMVYDVSEPGEAKFVTYFTGRDFSADVESEAAGDLGPEDLVFIGAEQSPNGKNLLVSANEVSGTITIMEIVP